MLYKEAGISIIMPTYNQGGYIRRAIAGLYAQVHTKWELVIINDGCTDSTEDTLTRVTDSRIKIFKNDRNEGLGFCLNQGMEQASFNYICYLPSDDIIYANHLSTLLDKLKSADNICLSFAGINYGSANTANGTLPFSSEDKIAGTSLQLVQVMHKKTKCRWMERKEMVTDDLDKMFWDRLSGEGAFAGTGVVSCEWVDHPLQRHKIIQEHDGGGIYLYKRHYKVNNTPLVFQSTVGSYIDERDIYKDFGNPNVKQDKLKILIVGELAYNPERICALENLGHKLYGLWIDDPHSYNTVGPLPFGNVTDLSFDDLENQIKEVKPDIIYALLNFQAVSLANAIMRAGLDIPFVWHFKEGPFFCRRYGLWKELVELYSNADGRIYINPEIKKWYEQFIEEDNSRPSYILDGDLPSAKWFTDNKSPLLSDIDGAIHTVTSGRPYGLLSTDVHKLAKHNIHLHLYGNHSHAFWSNWHYEIAQSAKNHFHLHPHCNPEKWVEEYSQYDAGWMHVFTSNNNNELLKCTWDDLNYPARMTTIAASGLPMIQRNNSGNIVATETLMRKFNMGIFFDSMDDLADQLMNKQKMNRIRENVWANREQFSFDNHAQGLVNFFMKVIEYKKRKHTVKTLSHA